MPLITSLPPELYYFIFRYLDEKDLLSIALVCKSLSNIIDNDERVWQGVCHRKYNCTYKYKSINWKYHVRSVGDLSFPYHHDKIDEWIVKLTQSNYVNFRSVFVLEHLGDQFSTETKEIVFQNLLQCGKDEEASVLVNELENLTVSNKNLLNVAIDTHCWTTCHYLLEKLKSFDQNVVKDYLNGEAQPCLHRAVGTTNYQLVKQLIDVNADVNFQDQFGNTPLHACSTKFFNCKNMGTNEDLKIVQLLLDNQANPNTVNMRGWNTAFNVYYLPALRLLVQNQVDINARTTAQQTALHWACGDSQSEIVKYLLDVGADVDPTDVDGSTPLHWAASAGSYDCCLLLLGRRANAAHKSLHNETAYDRASIYQQTEIAELLKQFETACKKESKKHKKKTKK